MQRDIQIVVKDRVARAVGQPVIVCGNCDYTVTFSFDDEWSEAGAKTARFKYLTAEGMKHIDKELTDNVVQAPMLSNIREVEVGVYSTDLATSTGAPIRCQPSVRCGSGEEAQDIIQTTIKATQEACRAELEESVETVTGESHDGKTWEELNDTVATLSTITEEQTQALGDWDLIKEYFKNIVGTSHHLFIQAPKDADGNSIPYRLPYIYTPKMKWSASSSAFSTSLLEVGIDVSSASAVGTTSAQRPFTSQTLERLIMTGNANAATLQNFMYSAFELQYIKLDTPSEDVLNLNPSYYGWAFYRCEKLQTIDCELDFTGQTDTKNMFVNCYRLKDLRIKPFTLSTSLALGQCRNLRKTEPDDYRNIITVLNAITNDQEVAKGITITFPGELCDITTDNFATFWDQKVYLNPRTGLWSIEDPIIENPGPEDVVLVAQLYDAFISKGVTIAWT